MDFYSMACIASQIEKFRAVINGRQICQPQVKTFFDAADLITPQFKAVCSGIDRMKTIMSERGAIC
jgi:hypothetical protein